LNTDQVLRDHLEQLSKAESPIYERVAVIDDAGAQREAGLLADTVVHEQLTVPAALPGDAAALRTLRLSVEAAKPDRACMNFLLRSFLSWMDAISSTARGQFLETLPKLAPACGDLGDDGMRLLIEAGNLEPGLLGNAASYAMTTAEAKKPNCCRRRSVRRQKRRRRMPGYQQWNWHWPSPRGMCRARGVLCGRSLRRSGASRMPREGRTWTTFGSWWITSVSG
jgi:hypothetical protein